jgi:hypothetical protein
MAMEVFVVVDRKELCLFESFGEDESEVERKHQRKRPCTDDQ